MSTIRIISNTKIEVIRDLAFSDRTPDLTKAGTGVIGTGNLLRVNVLKPFSYQFKKGDNVVPEPLVFIDPVTRKEVSESILTWPTVRKLIEKGVFTAYHSNQVIDLNSKEKEGKKSKNSMASAAEAAKAEVEAAKAEVEKGK